jgi:hypothetical protein
MKKLMLLIMGIGLVFVGCSHGNQKVVSKPVEKEVSQKPNDDKSVQAYAPLNGEPVNAVSNQRPVAVMVNNHHLARPQSGLSKADVVYELLAEGDITRLLAIFQNNLPERIGPVRSAREYYIKLANGYHALYICHGNSPQAKAMLDSGEIDALNGLIYDGTLFKRDHSRRAPHNSYIYKEGIEKGVVKKHYSFSENVLPLLFLHQAINYDSTWEKVGQVFIKYSNDPYNNVTYKYNDSKKQFQRIQKGIIATDAETKKELEIKNILIVEATHKIIDSHGHRSIDLQSGGNGYFVTEGMMKKIHWKNVNGRILPFDMEGNEVDFLPGQTWINVVPALKNVTLK